MLKHFLLNDSPPLKPASVSVLSALVLCALAALAGFTFLWVG